ncbi:hypothetical protein L596_006972 [Steinernema carpocapsae]|uniref:Uncharacterized protein n=1 Tax=Steinernema carpocapsae TaxID=34508 RepID=A0A4U5P7Q4_STECR|nr:hypothetical protein L596_006972 [Steinernema carpocapsae]
MHGIDVLLQPIGELVEDAEDLAGDMIQFALSRQTRRSKRRTQERCPGNDRNGKKRVGKMVEDGAEGPISSAGVLITSDTCPQTSSGGRGHSSGAIF